MTTNTHEYVNTKNIGKICKICDEDYFQCNCSDKEYRLKISQNPELLTENNYLNRMSLKSAKKLDGVTKQEWTENHPNSTWCDICKAPRNDLICPMCNAHLFPNFWG